MKEFTKSTILNADTDFYKGLPKIVQHYILIDLNVLNELLNIQLEY